MKDCTLELKNMNERNDYEARDAKFGLYIDETVNAEEPGAPKIETLMDILDSLVFNGGRSKKIDIHRHSKMSWTKMIEYIDWLKWKNLVVEADSYVVINERGRTLYNLLA